MNLKNMNEISIHVTVNIRSAMLAMIYKSKKKKENVLIVSCTIKLIGLKNINKHAYNLLKCPTNLMIQISNVSHTTKYWKRQTIVINYQILKAKSTKMWKTFKIITRNYS